MNISAISRHAAGLSLPSDQQKVAESCRQFEAGLWRSFLEKSLGSSASAGPGRGVYQYFMADTLANQMAGREGGFASHLQAQLTRHAPAPEI